MSHYDENPFHSPLFRIILAVLMLTGIGKLWLKYRHCCDGQKRKAPRRRHNSEDRRKFLSDVSAQQENLKKEWAIVYKKPKSDKGPAKWSALDAEEKKLLAMFQNETELYIDLHFLRENIAVEAARNKLRQFAAQQRLYHSPLSMSIVTGRGNNSKDKVPRIRNAIVSLLWAEARAGRVFHWKTVNEGMINVSVLFDCCDPANTPSLVALVASLATVAAALIL